MFNDLTLLVTFTHNAGKISMINLYSGLLCATAGTAPYLEFYLKFTANHLSI